jgi:hypothetical protein
MSQMMDSDGHSNREKIRLIALQNKIFDCEINKLFHTKKEIYRHAKLYVERQNRVIAECVRYIGKTINPEVFVFRYMLLLHCVRTCAEIEHLFPAFTKSPSAELRRILEMRSSETRRFIQRRWEHVTKSLDQLKGRKAKIIRLKNFFRDIEKSFGQLDSANEAFTIQLKREAADMLDCFELFRMKIEG